MDPSSLSLITLPQLSKNSLLIASLLISIVILIVFVYVVRSRSSRKRNLVLLVGDEGAGKTSIQSTILYEHTLPTHTSFQVNSSLITLGPKKQLQIVDIPGHARLRGQFKPFVPDAKAIVFVVDASTISRNGRQVAECLHEVLHAIVSLPPSRSLPPLLILAHKADLLASGASQDRESLAISRVRTVLERELEKRRAAATSGVGIEGLGSSSSGFTSNEGDDDSLGMSGLDCASGSNGAFKFSHWEGGEVEFAATWVEIDSKVKESEKYESDSIGLDSLKSFLESL